MKNVDLLTLFEERAAQTRFQRKMLERMPQDLERAEFWERFESRLEVSAIEREQAKRPLPERLRPRYIQLQGGALMRYDPQKDELPPYPNMCFPQTMCFVVGNAEDANSIRNYISGKRTRIGEFLFGNR